MKTKIRTLSPLISLPFLLASQAQASLLFYDGFSAGNYSAGTVDTQPYGGTGYASGGTWNSNSEFVSGGLTHPSLVTTPGFHFSRSSGEAFGFLDLSPTGTFGTAGLIGSNGKIGGTDVAETLYFSVLARKDTADAGFAGFQIYDDALGGPGEGLGVGEVGPDGYKWLQGGSNGLIGDPPTPLAEGEVQLFVFKMNFGDATGEVWINPDPSLSEGDQAAGTSSTVAAAQPEAGFDSFRLRGSQDYSYDEIRMGTTWDSVTPVPEPSGTLLSLLALAGFSLRRSRKS